MKKTKVKCPRCHSDQLYKLGLEYQCKNCKQQFVAGDNVGHPKRNYPKCPKCGKATYLHHQYKHYNRYKCGNRKCNHIIVEHHNLNIDNASSEDSAFTLINEVKKFGEPSNFVTDRLPSYNQAVAKVLPNTKHISVAPMSSDTSNNLIESFNKTFKAWYKAKKGFNSLKNEQANLKVLGLMLLNLINQYL